MSGDAFEPVRAMIDALPDGVLVHVPGKGVIHANPAFSAFLGRDDSLVGASSLELVHPDERASMSERISQTLATGRPTAPTIVRFLRRDGSIALGECRGASHRVGDEVVALVMVRDLAEQRRAVSALETSEALFRALILDLRVGVVVQGPSAEILVSNRAALELLGLDEPQLLGKTSFDPDWNVMHEDGTPFPGSEHPVPTAIRTKRPVRGIVMAVYRPKCKDRVWLLVDAEPQLDTRGDVARVVCTFSDITERKRLEAQAAAGDRLASMGRLAAGVAHEINNPLAYVIGHLEALRAGSLEPAQRTNVDEALEGIARVRTIVDELRSLSRGDDESRGPVDLLGVITSACNIAAPHLRHRATLVRDLAPVPMVEGNESRVGQLVLNLVMNAAEAVPEGHAIDNQVRVGVHVDPEGWVVLEVSDTGEGIPENVIGRIFDPFFTTKPMGVGTGLGLSICHGIVRSLGGEIDVESTPGKGATFRVRLRASTSPAPQRIATPAPAGSAEVAEAAKTTQRSRVLVIDDEPRVGELLVKLLSPEYDASVALRASDALDRIRTGARYDVVLCDLMMPDMTGMDLQEALERDVPELATRTIFMTGGAFTPRAQEFVDRFAGRLIEKPFRLADVQRAVTKMLGSGARGTVTASPSR